MISYTNCKIVDDTINDLKINRNFAFSSFNVPCFVPWELIFSDRSSFHKTFSNSTKVVLRFLKNGMICTIFMIFIWIPFCLNLDFALFFFSAVNHRALLLVILRKINSKSVNQREIRGH